MTLSLKPNSKWKKIIKELDVDEKTMTSRWEELREDVETVNNNLNFFRIYRDLLKYPEGWKCLPEHQMRYVHDHLEKVKAKREEILRQKKLEEEETKKREEELKYNEEHFDEIFLNRFDNGEEFSNEELRQFAYGDTVEVIEKIKGEDHRWQKEMTTVFRVGDRYFAIDWMSALTEMQEDDFWDQPYEVKQIEKTIVVKEWIKK